MTTQSITYHRLINQGLFNSRFKSAHQLIAHMGCLQAQDYHSAKWAIGNRIEGITDAAIEKDFNDGKILRTHVLRPTWHFVTPQDIHWMLELTAPKIRAQSKSLHKQLSIDDTTLKKSRKIIAKALSKGEHLEREELKASLATGRVNTDDIRLGLLLMDAEIEGIVCSGKRRGKQFTYALMEERAPEKKVMTHDEAVAELGKRYFMSRGPATLQDFMWWSGLTLKDAKKAVELNRSLLNHDICEAQAYWFSGDPVKAKKVTAVRFLPPFDEYMVSYKDRSYAVPPSIMKETGNGIFKPVLLTGEKASGTWKPVRSKNNIIAEVNVLTPGQSLTPRLLKIPTEAYARFTGKPVALHLNKP